MREAFTSRFHINHLDHFLTYIRHLSSESVHSLVCKALNDDIDNEVYFNEYDQISYDQLVSLTNLADSMSFKNL